MNVFEKYELFLKNIIINYLAGTKKDINITDKAYWK